jgi:hypothetical protein
VRSLVEVAFSRARPNRARLNRSRSRLCSRKILRKLLEHYCQLAEHRYVPRSISYGCGAVAGF